MNLFFVLISYLLALFVGCASGIELQGRWKENANGREGLNDFLYQIGMNWFKRVYIRSVSWSNEENIFQDGDNFRIYGYSGPTAKVFSQNFVADNKTLTQVDMGELGGNMFARAFIDDQDRLVVHMTDKVGSSSNEEGENNKGKGQVKLETRRTRKRGSRELLVEVKHLSSGSVLTSSYLKQG